MFSSRIFGSKNVRTKQILGLKDFWSKKFLSKRKYLVKSNSWSNKNLGLTEFCVKQNFGSTKILGQEKFWARKMLGPKNVWPNQSQLGLSWSFGERGYFFNERFYNWDVLWGGIYLQFCNILCSYLYKYLIK